MWYHGIYIVSFAYLILSRNSLLDIRQQQSQLRSQGLSSSRRSLQGTARWETLGTRLQQSLAICPYFVHNVVQFGVLADQICIFPATLQLSGYSLEVVGFSNFSSGPWIWRRFTGDPCAEYYRRGQTGTQGQHTGQQRIVKTTQTMSCIVKNEISTRKRWGKIKKWNLFCYQLAERVTTIS